MSENLNEKFDSIKDSLNPLKILGAPLRLLSAIKKSAVDFFTAKDKSLMERLKIAINSFKEELKGVAKEKEKVSQDTSEAVKKGYEETLKDAKETVALKTDVAKENKELFDEVLATSVASFESLDEDNQAQALEGLKKMEKAAESDEVEPLSFDQIGAVSGLAFKTLKNLKEQYPSEKKFAEMLDRFYKVSAHSKFPLDKLLSGKALGVFKLQINPSDFGQLAKGLSFLKKFGIDEVSAMDAVSAFSGFGESTLKDKDGMVNVMKKYFFPNTGSGKVGEAVETMHEMVQGGEKSISAETLAKFVFTIDDKDFARLAELLTGKK